MLRNSTPLGFPKVWTVAGYILLLLVAVFVGRIVFEETVLTWAYGPQMIGFSMAHTMPLMILAGLIGLGGGLLWFLVSLVWLFRRRFRIPIFDWLPIVLLALLGVMISVPYETWEELMVRSLGRSRHGGEFLVQAASENKRRFVDLLLRKEYDVNYENGSGSTPLSGASVQGNDEMVRFLISRGADVNRKDRSVGESPLMAAAEMGKFGTVKVLLDKGAEPCALDKEGHTAEGLARKYHHTDIADYLSSNFRCMERIPSCTDFDVSACVDASEEHPAR